MKPKTLAAIILIALGIAGFVYQGVLLMNSGRDVSFGATHMTTERWYSVPLPPVFGAIALIGGIALLLMDKDDFNPAATP
jgi:Ni/Fe-hydrogenase subunit HybB-like protein